MQSVKHPYLGLLQKSVVERKGFAFFVDVEYENLPDYCDHCKFIGHKFENCKRRKDGMFKEAPKKVVADTTKKYGPVQTKEKTDEIINVEGSTSQEITLPPFQMSTSKQTMLLQVIQTMMDLNLLPPELQRELTKPKQPNHLLIRVATTPDQRLVLPNLQNEVLLLEYKRDG
ncbi:NADPH:quinone oxidoreductase-like [Trifolium medium]|uniref:NADPH:quinone oxidoreductase-like n=1 Tax=Trifolium medium TaxID=97028 RepID=A0A392LX81_9FABA|nr:NADPH:quinone oxidoreductase-like [Trifolium medium]